MKLKWCAGLVLAGLLLSGCDHHKTASNSAPAPRGDSELTGTPPQPIDSLKSPPRATLVALPGHSPALNPAPSAASQAPVSATTASSAPSETGTPVTSTMPELSASGAQPSSETTTSMPESAPASESTPAAPAPSPPSDTASAMPGAVGEAGSVREETNAPAAADNSEVAVIQTSLGKIVIELDDFAAPKTCKNFRQLIADGFYNNTVFHRVIPHFIIQGGDPKSKSVASDRNTYGLGSPGYTLPAEIALKHDRGAVAMARLPDSLNPQRESNGSQFYICLAACPSLDDQYTVFGHVIQGLDVAEKIAAQPRDDRDNPLQRMEMTVSLEPRDQAVANDSASAAGASAAGP
jgi:peptidyl-prolyl cis-trans isomerase B (cyclophilin B)